MSLNTLETAYANGQIIDASHINELTLSLLGQFVGRDANGIPTVSQSLGTLALPWGNLYANGIILGGLALDTSQITSLPNRVVSGKSRALSSMPDFLRANGAALSLSILGATIDLVLSINNTATTITSDLTKTGLTAAPAANNTAAINDTTIVSDLYAGESDAAIPEIIIDAVGTEISSRVGQIVAFKTPTGEYFQGLVKTATKITNVFRGYYFDSSGTPVVRGVLSNNDVITLMNIGWVFVEDNGTTIDVSYTTPSISYNSPAAVTGAYWFDITNQVWKRYSGTSWDIINRTLIGQIISDTTNTVASRPMDFSNKYQELNNIEVEIDTTEIVKSKLKSSRVNVYGTELNIDLTKISWNITTDLESPLVEAISTDYYLYISDEGQEVISDEKPFERLDLKGFYHPFHSWRCVGIIFNDASSNLLLADDTKFNPNIDSRTIKIKDTRASGVASGTSTLGSWQTRVGNTIENNNNSFAALVSNQHILIAGKYRVKGFASSYKAGAHQARYFNTTDTVETIIGTSEVSSSGGTDFTATKSIIEGDFIMNTTKIFELQHQSASTRSGDGFGSNMIFGSNNVYSGITLEKVG